MTDFPKKLCIRLEHDPVLRGRCSKVTEFGPALADFCDRMRDLMTSHDGLGLAAPQVGVSKRIFVTHQKPHIWINPTILEYTGVTCSTEGCLSLVGQYHRIARKRKITVQYFDVDGIQRMKKLDATKGRLSIVAQHEMDHLDGILFVDHLVPP